MNDKPEPVHELAADPVRREIAAAAARLLADGAPDYAHAKRKAARSMLGTRGARGRMPDNVEIDQALLEHLELFDTGHARRVRQRRQIAAQLMLELERFRPYLTGGVWKGIVTEYAPIHLQLFHDDTKDVQIDLLNRGVRFETGTMPHFRSGDDVEAFTFWHAGEPVLLSLYRHDDLRGALRATPGAGSLPERGDRGALLERMTADADPAADPATEPA